MMDAKPSRYHALVIESDEFTKKQLNTNWKAEFDMNGRTRGLSNKQALRMQDFQYVCHRHSRNWFTQLKVQRPAVHLLAGCSHRYPDCIERNLRRHEWMSTRRNAPVSRHILIILTRLLSESPCFQRVQIFCKLITLNKNFEDVLLKAGLKDESHNVLEDPRTKIALLKCRFSHRYSTLKLVYDATTMQKNDSNNYEFSTATKTVLIRWTHGSNVFWGNENAHFPSQRALKVAYDESEITSHKLLYEYKKAKRDCVLYGLSYLQGSWFPI